jgi:predicted dehydrogenase
MTEQSKNLRVGVIGLGMGKHVIGDIQKHPNAELVAIADLKEELLNQVGDQKGISKRYTDGEEMLEKEELDLVHVSVPNHLHRPLTIAALESGCHVLCEKPMALNAAEAQEMLDAAEKADRRLMINFSFRFAPTSWALKREVDKGLLGNVYFARTVWLRRLGPPIWGRGWFLKKECAGGGPLIDLGVHRLDLALWLMGHPKPQWVMATTHDKIMKKTAKKAGLESSVEDFAAALIRFENGAMLELEASWASHIKRWEHMETRLLGTEGGLVQFNVGDGYEFDAELYFERNGTRYDMKPHLAADGVRPNPIIDDHCGSMAHFVDAIVNDTPHIATGQEGLMVMQILDAIYESAEKGTPVQIS